MTASRVRQSRCRLAAYDALVTIRCGDVTLTEGRMGRVGDRVSVRVAKPLRKPRTTFAMFEGADGSNNKRMEAP